MARDGPLWLKYRLFAPLKEDDLYFIPSLLSQRNINREKSHRYTGGKNLDPALEYFSFNFGAKYYVWWPHNCSAVLKSTRKRKTSGQSLSNVSREVLPRLAQLSVPHPHIRGTSSVLHFAYLDWKCALGKYNLYISVLSQLASVGLINCKFNYLRCIRTREGQKVKLRQMIMPEEGEWPKPKCIQKIHSEKLKNIQLWEGRGQNKWESIIEEGKWGDPFLVVFGFHGEQWSEM